MSIKFNQTATVRLLDTITTAVPFQVSADFNQDGTRELVIFQGHPAGAQPNIYDGTQSGRLLILAFDGGVAREVTNEVLNGPVPQLVTVSALLARDFNVDGMAPGQQSPHFLMNDGSGRFTVNTSRLPKTVSDTYIGTSAGGVPNQFMDSHLADFNRDGSPDLLLLPTWSTDRPFLYLNDGKGNFSDDRKITLPAGLFGAGSQARNAAGGSVQKGTGNFTHAVADLNGDGYLDVIASQVGWDDAAGKMYYAGQLQILINDAGKGFIDETSWRLVASPLAAENFTNYFDPQVADINGDGRPDLVVNVITAKGGYSSKVFVSDTGGRLVESADFSVPGLLFPIDSNGDGLIDLVNLEYLIAGSTAQGLGIFTPQLTIYLNAQAALRLSGDDGVDNLQGTSGNDVLQGFGADDQIDGAGGIDTAVFRGARAEYRIIGKGADLTVMGPDGTDVLLNVERIKFSDMAVAMDVDGDAGQAYRLYQAAFNRMPDQSGIGFQMSVLDNGASLKSVAQNFLNSPEFARTYGGLADAAFANTLYQNVLHRTPDASGLAFQLNALQAGTDRAQLLVNFSESPENQAALIGVISSGMPYL